MESQDVIADRVKEIGAGTRVKDPNTGVEYELRKHLASGRYSYVYLAKRTDGSGLSKVVKFGALPPGEITDSSRRLQNLKERYELEVQISRRIREASSGRFVPEIVEGEWPYPIPVLIMDKMGGEGQDEDWSLSTQIRALQEAGELLQAERLAAKAGAQYAELLKILHEKLHQACPDRKPGDFYWDPNKSQLYVLDWNVVEELPNSSAEADKKVQIEIRQFGERWFEMLLGVSPKSVDQFQFEQSATDVSWGTISRGMRNLVLRTLSAGLTPDGLRNDSAAVEAWWKYKLLLEKSSHELCEEAKTKWGVIQQSASDREVWNATWTELEDIQALLERERHPFSSEIKDWMQKRETELRKQFDSKMREGKGWMNMGSYSDAAPCFQGNFDDDRFKPEWRLQAGRWFLVCESVSEAIKRGSELGKTLGNELSTVLADIDREDWTQAKSRLEAIGRRQYGSTNSDVLNFLEAEITTHLALQRFSRKDLSPRDRLAGFEQARGALEKLKGQDDSLLRTYKELIKETAGYDTAKVIAETVKIDAAKESAIEDERGRIKDTIDRIGRKLKEYGEKTPARWPDLTEELECWEYDPRTPPFLERLASLNRAIKRGGLSIVALDAAKRAFETPVDAEPSEVVSDLKRLLHELGYRRLKEFQEEPRWPFKVDDGVQFAKHLRDSDLSKGDHKDDIEKYSNELGNFQKLQQQLRNELGLPNPSPGAIKNDSVIKALQQAADQGIELYDPLPGDPDPEQMRVTRLLESGKVEKWMDHQQELKKNLEELEKETEDLNQQVVRLKERYEQVRKQVEVEASQEPTISDGPNESVPLHEAGLPGEAPGPKVAKDGGGWASRIKPRLKPILLGMVALGVVAVGILLLLMAPPSPLYRVWPRSGASEVTTITYGAPSARSGESIRLDFLVEDGKGNSVMDQFVTVETSGHGKLRAFDQHQFVSAKGDRYLVLRTDNRGVRVMYERPSAGDIITATNSGVLITYTVPAELAVVPTSAPIPVPATSTPVPQPKLDLTIDVVVDGQPLEIARPGQQLVYTIKATNSGEGPAEDVTLRCDPLPNNAKPSSLGSLEVVEGFLTKRQISISPNQLFSSSLVYVIDSISPTETLLQLKCRMVFTGGSVRKSSRPVKLEMPKPLIITLEPRTLEIGIGEDQSLEVTVQNEAGTLLSGQQLEVSIEPEGIVVATSPPSATDAYGKATLTISGQRMGEARLNAGVVNAQGSGTAIVQAWPLLKAPTRTSDGRDGAFIRREPSTSSDPVSVNRSEPFKIIGRNADASWLEIRLPEGDTAWVYKTGVGVEVLHEAEIGNLSVTDKSSQPSPVPQPSAATAREASLQALGADPLVPFYKVGLAGTTGIFLYLPAGSNRVTIVEPAPQEKPPSGYQLVTVSFWVQEALIMEQAASLKLKQVSGVTEWACWQAPGSDPAQVPANCSELPERAEPIDVLGSAAGTTNGWRQVTARSWIKSENLK